MGIWEHNGIEKNLDELKGEIDKIKTWTLAKIDKLEEMTSLKKIQRFQNLNLERTTVQLREDSGWYSKNFYIHLHAPKDVVFNNPVKLSSSDKSWDSRLFKIRISEDNAGQLENLKQIVEELYELDKPIHQENLAVKQDNTALSRTLFNIFDQIGLSTKYYGYKSNRSSKKTEMYYEFPSEIRKQIPTSYSDNYIDELKAQILKKIDDIWNKEIAKVKEERLKKEKEQQEKESNRKLALLLAKYDLDLSQDWDDVLRAIIDKNKYLYLAHYLEKNRGDWSDGYDYAETGLSMFLIETETDQDIYDDIHSYIENWDGDGRVFRDCEWNYSRLFGMAEEQDKGLYSDYCTAKENISDY